VAATITDSRIDAVTVPRRNAVQISTAPRAAMTSSLQLMAPVRWSHRGTERAGWAAVTAVIAAQRAYRARKAPSRPDVTHLFVVIGVGDLPGCLQLVQLGDHLRIGHLIVRLELELPHDGDLRSRDDVDE